jgi:filamentous hemagglutinin family protein
MTCIDRRNGRRIASFRTTAAARTLLTSAVAIAAVLPALPVQAAPAGGEIKAGAGVISQQGLTTTITQSASQTQQPARMVIDWNSFSSAASESIVFNQPNAAAIALNRVTGVNPSQLMGTLTANGQVFILNPNGVLFGAGSQVNVRGLLASTLGMDTAGFMGGAYVLQGSSSAKVLNQGSIKAGDGGYVALVGPAVVNDGRISASKGDALLAAGDKVTLRLEGGGLLGYSMDLGRGMRWSTIRLAASSAPTVAGWCWKRGPLMH